MKLLSFNKNSTSWENHFFEHCFPHDLMKWIFCHLLQIPSSLSVWSWQANYNSRNSSHGYPNCCWDFFPSSTKCVSSWRGRSQLCVSTFSFLYTQPYEQANILNLSRKCPIYPIVNGNGIVSCMTVQGFNLHLFLTNIFSYSLCIFHDDGRPFQGAPIDALDTLPLLQSRSFVKLNGSASLVKSDFFCWYAEKIFWKSLVSCWVVSNFSLPRFLSCS